MKLDIKPLTALAIGGIALAGIFCLTAIISPRSLDWLLNPSDERSAQIKREMERQQGVDTRPKREEEAKSEEITPPPLPQQTPPPPPPPLERDIQREDRIPRPECISRDQVVRAIDASEEAWKGRVVGISVTPDGHRIMVAYRKKTFLGIGSGENQVEGILQRGLRNRFPDHLIKSMKVHSDGNSSVRRGAQDVNVEVLEIETFQAGCR